MSNFTPPPRVLSALDEIKLRLTAEPVNGGKGRPSLSVRVVKNNIRMTVYTNVEGDAGGGKIEAALDSVNFFVFLKYLDQAIRSKDKFRRNIQNKNFVWTAGKRADTPTLVSTIVIEKDEEGCVFISIINNLSTPVKFYFLPSSFHSYHGPDGQVNKAEETQVYASAWLELMSRLSAHVLAANFVPPEPRPEGGYKGGQSNNYQGGGGNRGNNYQQRSQPTQAAGSTTAGVFDDSATWTDADDGLSFN